MQQELGACCVLRRRGLFCRFAVACAWKVDPLACFCATPSKLWTVALRVIDMAKAVLSSPHAGRRSCVRARAFVAQPLFTAPSDAFRTR